MSAPQMMAPGGDPLDGLRGLHLPDAVGAWPPAPGWWALALSIVAVIGLLLFVRRVRRASLAHHALCELDRLGATGGDVQALASSVSTLLRRVAVRRFGRARVASLAGAGWQEFLSETGPQSSRRTPLSADLGRLIAWAPYAPPGSSTLHLAGVEIGREGVLAAARDWIRWNT